jgi:CO/xanthine dehydrogenase Mo-binding subunit
MPTGAWRGLGAAPNTFAVESAVDELAALAGADPIAFRVQHADFPRLEKVLDSVRALSGWDRHPGGERALGVAAAAYKQVTFVAIVAEVTRRDGRPAVTHLWCAHDCGLVVNPDQVRAQIEGNLIWGIGMALTESYELKNGIAATDNFHSYRIPRQRQTPDIDIQLVASSEAPTGAGEAAFAPAAAAVANALAALDGSRTRRLPLT